MIQASAAQEQTTHEPCKLQLGEMLLSKGLITKQQLEQGLAGQGHGGHRKLLGEVLVELGFVTEDQVLEVLAEAYGVPFAKISPRLADPRVVEVLPREFLEAHGVLPLFLVNDHLTVAVSEPANLYLVEEISRLCGHSVRIVASSATDIQNTLRQYLPDANVFVIDDIYQDLNPDDFTLVERKVTELSKLEEVAGHSPVVKLVNFLIYSAVQEGASDIHIEPESDSLRIRYRVDGRLYQKLTPPPAMQLAIVSRIKIMSGMDISERRLPQDGDIHVMLDGRPVDLRVSTMPGKNGEKVVVRIIDSAHSTVGVEKLGFNAQMLSDWQSIVEQPNGVILVTGPTGSGKTTTLYSAISQLNTEDINISTVEDPVEAGMPGVNQFQVNEKAGFSFTCALRSLLRQDPDVIMVGEIRDSDTARIMTQAALTGHLVLTTLHTNDAPGAVTRLIDLGIEPYLVAAILRGVLAQRLVRKICVHCRQAYEPDGVTRKAIEAVIGKFEMLYRGVGCPRCRGTGYSGRVGVFELFLPTEKILEAVGNGASVHEIRSTLNKRDYTTLRQDGLRKATEGLTTPDEVFYSTAIG